MNDRTYTCVYNTITKRLLIQAKDGFLEGEVTLDPTSFDKDRWDDLCTAMSSEYDYCISSGSLNIYSLKNYTKITITANDRSGGAIFNPSVRLKILNGFCVNAFHEAKKAWN